MGSAAERRHPNYAVITAGVLAVILYGSFYPFRWAVHQGELHPFRELFSTAHVWPGLSHFVMNVLLYLPFGFSAVQVVKKGTLLKRFVITALIGIVLSFSIEIAQVYFYGRDSELADILGNAIGTLAGASLGAVFEKAGAPTISRPFVWLLLACIAGSWLFPFRPAFRIAKYISAIQLLRNPPAIAWFDLLKYFATWLAIAMLIEAAVGARRSRWVLPCCVFAILAGRIVIADIVLLPVELIGGVAAVLIWITILARVKARGAIVFALFAVSLVVVALEPFHFLSHPRQFVWIPFRALISAPTELGVRIFLEKVFVYGSLVWLAVRGGMSILGGVLASVVILVATRIGQVYLPGRSADITDVLMLLMIAGLLVMMREDPRAS